MPGHSVIVLLSILHQVTPGGWTWPTTSMNRRMHALTYVHRQQQLKLSMVCRGRLELGHRACCIHLPGVQIEQAKQVYGTKGIVMLQQHSVFDVQKRLVPGHCAILPTEHIASARQVEEQI